MKLTEEQWKQVQEKRVRGGIGPAGVSRVAPKREQPNAKPMGQSHGHRLQSGNAGSMSRLGAGSNPAPSPPKPPYKSKLELHWATRLEVMRRQGEIDGWLYEPFTFRLAEGKRYRADFLAWTWVESIRVDGSSVGYYVTTAYECKGWHKNYRDSLTHLKWATQRFPFFQWKKVVRNGKSGFEVYDVVV